MPVRNDHEVPHLVTMLRRPGQRLSSAYAHKGGPHGVPPPERDGLRTILDYASYCPASVNGTAISQSAMQCAADKQCAYIAGRPCRLPEDTRDAIGRMRRFAFVGLTELWNESCAASSLDTRASGCPSSSHRTHTASAWLCVPPCPLPCSPSVLLPFMLAYVVSNMKRCESPHVLRAHTAPLTCSTIHAQPLCSAQGLPVPSAAGRQPAANRVRRGPPARHRKWRQARWLVR